VTGLTAELVGWRAMFKNRDRAQDGEVRRLALRIHIPFLLLAASALHRAEHGEAAFSTGAWMESRARALGVWEGPPEPLLKGRHLVKHGLKTGRAMGEMLDLVFQLQLDGTITNREDALAWVSERAGAAQWKEGVSHGGDPSSGAPASGAPAKDFEKPLGGGKNKGRGGKP